MPSLSTTFELQGLLSLQERALTSLQQRRNLSKSDCRPGKSWGLHVRQRPLSKPSLSSSSPRSADRRAAGATTRAPSESYDEALILSARVRFWFAAKPKNHLMTGYSGTPFRCRLTTCKQDSPTFSSTYLLPCAHEDDDDDQRQDAFSPSSCSVI